MASSSKITEVYTSDGNQIQLRLHLDQAADGSVFLLLSSPKTVPVEVQINDLLAGMNQNLSSKEEEEKKKKKKKGRKEKGNGKKNKLTKEPAVDRYDWSEHEFVTVLRDFGLTKKQSKKEREQKKRRKRRAKRRKSKSPKNKNQKRKSPKHRKNEDAPHGSKATLASKADPTPSPLSTYDEPMDLVNSRAHGKDPFPVIYSSQPRKKKRIANRSLPCPLPAISLSDLRSPLAWNRRRQEILQQVSSTRRPGIAKVWAISLSNPFQVISGYFLASNGTSDSKLDEVLSGGAFVYRLSGRERKMIRWQKVLTRHTPSMSPSSPTRAEPFAPRLVNPTSFRSLIEPSIPPSYRSNQQRIHHTALMKEESILDKEELQRNFGSNGLIRDQVRGGVGDNDERNEATSIIDHDVVQSPSTLNTLRQIEELESFDTATDKEDELRHVRGGEGDNDERNEATSIIDHDVVQSPNTLNTLCQIEELESFDAATDKEEELRHVRGGVGDNDERNEAKSMIVVQSPNTLNTLRQIEELESFDAATDAEDEDEGNQGKDCYECDFNDQSRCETAFTMGTENPNKGSVSRSRCKGATTRISSWISSVRKKFVLRRSCDSLPTKSCSS